MGGRINQQPTNQPSTSPSFISKQGKDQTFSAFSANQKHQLGSPSPPQPHSLKGSANDQIDRLSQMAILCRLISSIPATAAVATLLLGRAFRLPSTFTQDPAPFSPSLHPLYVITEDEPRSNFFRLIAVLGKLVINEDPSDVVEFVGGPGEYIVTVNPGRDAGSGNSSCDSMNLSFETVQYTL